MHVLIVDDDRSLRHALRKALSRKGASISEAENGTEALGPLREGTTRGGSLDVCVLDVRMPGLDGLEVLRRTIGRAVPVIVLTGHGTIPDAVTAMRLGACNFVQKPVDAEELWPLLEQAVRERRDAVPQSMLGESTALRSFLGQLERAASSDEPVLLLGETGSGKELAARRLHEVGPRCGSPFVAVNVASIPSELFESELYGHRKGSFTGADRDRVGLFAEAAEGTLFIDEVGDLPLDAQVKLLRTLEGRCFRPVGANHEQPFAGRVVAATHQDLPRLVEAGRFRKDLYYRLSVIPLALPPLRSRGEDILVIADAWLERLQGEHRRLRLSDDAKARLRGYSFPGNVRELVNLMKRAAIFTRSDEIDAALLEELLCSSPFQARSAESGGLSAGQRVTVESLERAHITRLLEELNNVSEVARVAGIDRRTLQRKMIAWGLRHDGE